MNEKYLNQQNNSDDKLIIEQNPVILQLINSINEKQKINMICYIDDAICDEHLNIDIDHQESPLRTQAIRKALKIYKLNNIMGQIKSNPVKISDLFMVHEDDYIHTLIDYGISNTPCQLPESSSESSMSNINSLKAIMMAAGSVIKAVESVCECNYIKIKNNKQYHTKRITKVFCNIRPPGHHAHHNKGAGFCFINNVAVGAQYALNKYSDNIKKILIFDWDLHHGDGTEDIFKNNSNVMYVSFHRGGKYINQFYPFTGIKKTIDNIDEIDDVCKIKENIINFPIAYLEHINSYMHKFNTLFLPIAYNFNPDLVFISAGFDSHKDDLYHALPLDYIHYHEMTKSLMKLADECADGRLISALEGGYTLDVLVKSVIVHVATMIDG